MRNMSFFLTTQQFLDYLKDITRRLGWITLKPGEHFMAIQKAQGLKKGEHIRKLGECICIRNEPEPLFAIEELPQRGIRSEVEREGFPDMTPKDFVKMFCEANSKGKKKCYPDTIINRIEFRRISIPEKYPQSCPTNMKQIYEDSANTHEFPSGFNKGVNRFGYTL